MRARPLKLHNSGQKMCQRNVIAVVCFKNNIHQIHHPVRDQVYYNTHPVQKCFV